MIPLEYILGAGAAVGLTLYIIFGGDAFYNFSDDYASTGSSLSAVGLMNLGQTCFFNAVLQALASCQTFCDWMATEAATNSKHCHKNLCDLLHRIFTNLKGSHRSAVADTRVLARLLDEIRGHGWVVENSEQHDAHELFQAIMNLLHSSSDDMLDVLKPIAGSCTSEDDREQSDELHTFHKCKIEQPILKTAKTPMLGYIASGMTCKTCLRKSSIKYTQFTSLNLSLPPATHNKMFELEELLNYFFLSENLSDVDCANCSRKQGTTVKRHFVKEQSLGKTPQCLCLHVQRLGWYGYHAALKRHDRVTFPAMLDLTTYTQLHRMLNCFSHNRAFVMSTSPTNQQASNIKSKDTLPSPATQDQTRATDKLVGSEDLTLPTSKKGHYHNSSATDEPADQSQASVQQSHDPQTSCTRSWYTLVSVIEHRGSEVSGHFVTYRKVDRDKGKWIYTSDLHVNEVSAEYVHSRQPYMLFYEKMNI